MLQRVETELQGGYVHKSRSQVGCFIASFPYAPFRGHNSNQAIRGERIRISRNNSD